MRALRFIRRLVFSAFIGALAFGLSGLALRPQPSWSISFPRQTLFVDHPAVDADAPIWVFTTHAKHTWLPGAVAAFDPHTGAHLFTARPPDDFVYQGLTILPDGRLMGRAILPNSEFNTLKTWFAVYDARTQHTFFERSFDDYWEPINDGQRVWRIEPTPAGFRLLIRRLFDGSIAHDFPYDTGRTVPDRLNVTLSPDGKTLVVCEWIKANRAPGFELWDVDSKKLLRRVSLPPSTLQGRPTRAAGPHFRNGRLQIVGQLQAGDHKPHEIWRYDLDSGEFTNDDWKPSPPQGMNGHRLQSQDGLNGDTVWTAYDLDAKHLAWFAVYRAKEQRLPWRCIPFDYRIFGGYIGIEGGRDYGLEVHPVPTRSQFIAFVAQSSLRESLPEFLHPIADHFFELDSWRQRRLWHDWPSDSWRDIGCPAVAHYQIRPDAFLTLSSNEDGRSFMQSWPLPPRDPRPLAALIGVLSFAIAWWLPLPWQRRPKAPSDPTRLQ